MRFKVGFQRVGGKITTGMKRQALKTGNRQIEIPVPRDMDSFKFDVYSWKLCQSCLCDEKGCEKENLSVGQRIRVDRV